MLSTTYIVIYIYQFHIFYLFEPYNADLGALGARLVSLSVRKRNLRVRGVNPPPAMLAEPGRPTP